MVSSSKFRDSFLSESVQIAARGSRLRSPDVSQLGIVPSPRLRDLEGELRDIKANIARVSATCRAADSAIKQIEKATDLGMQRCARTERHSRSMGASIQELITLLVEVERASAAASSNDPHAQIRSDVTAGGTALKMLDRVAATSTGASKSAANGQGGPGGESGTSSTKCASGRQDMHRQLSESPASASAKQLQTAPGADFGGSIIARAAMDAAKSSSSPSSSASASATASASESAAASAFPSLPAAHGDAAPHRTIAAFPSLAALLGGEHERQHQHTQHKQMIQPPRASGEASQTGKGAAALGGSGAVSPGVGLSPGRGSDAPTAGMGGIEAVGGAAGSAAVKGNLGPGLSGRELVEALDRDTERLRRAALQELENSRSGSGGGGGNDSTTGSAGTGGERLTSLVGHTGTAGTGHAAATRPAGAGTDALLAKLQQLSDEVTNGPAGKAAAHRLAIDRAQEMGASAKRAGPSTRGESTGSGSGSQQPAINLRDFTPAPVLSSNFGSGSGSHLDATVDALAARMEGFSETLRLLEEKAAAASGRAAREAMQ